MKRITVKGAPGLLVQGDVADGPLTLPSTPGVSEDGQVLAWDNGAGEFAWTSASGGGAPTTADYLVKTADAGLSAERVVTDTSWISVDWGTAGQAKFNLADAGLVSLASADAAAGLPYVSGANTWASLSPGTRGDRLTQGTSAPEWSGPTYWGSGSDGAVAFDGTNTFGFASTTGAAPNLVYTLTRDVEASSISISGGITVNTAGFVLYCTGTFSGSGTLQMVGGSGSGVSAGTGFADIGSLNVRSQNGGAGRTGTSGTGSGGTGGLQTIGGSGGNGGTGGGANTGGNGGTATAPAAAVGAWRTLQTALRIMRAFTGTTALQLRGGCGGGGGGYTAGAGGNGGGGGAGGGIILVFARYVTFTGTISVRGGNGGNATSGGGSAGGGGGGGGGYLAVVTTTPTASYTATAAGGTKGTGAGGSGADGVDGSAGVTDHFVL